jgi:hypothetical protein
VLGTWSFTPGRRLNDTTMTVREVHDGASDPATIQTITRAAVPYSDISCVLASTFPSAAENAEAGE